MLRQQARLSSENEGNLYSVENPLARARVLAFKLRERSYNTNKTGRIPDETITDFWDYHLNYLLRPKKFGWRRHCAESGLRPARGSSSTAF